MRLQPYIPEDPLYPGQVCLETLPWEDSPNRHPDGSYTLPNGDIILTPGGDHPGDWEGEVPPSYFQDRRPWGGHKLYRNASWTGLVRGQLLVIGPPLDGKQRRNDKYSGTICMYISPVHKANYEYGEYSAVLTAWGWEANFMTARLVPIEECVLSCVRNRICPSSKFSQEPAESIRYTR